MACERFDFQCTILNDSTVTGTLSAESSVEQVKKWIFNNSPSLFSLSRDDFRIVLEPQHTIEQALEEERMFLDCSPTFRYQASRDQVITVHLISINPSITLAVGNPRRSPLLPARQRSVTVFNSSTKEGYLTKRGNSFQSWKRRWCILQNNFIFYFRKKQEDSQPLGAVPIQDCSYCGLCPYAGKSFCFAIYTRARIYYMTGKSLRESNEWISVINQCMNSLGITPIDPSEEAATEHISSTKSGFLHKTGKEVKSGWKKRYFRMKGNFLYYFKSKKAPSPCGVIPLQDALVYLPDESNFSRKYMFHVQTNHRTYNLAAEEEGTMRDWMEAIHNVVTNTSSCEFLDSHKISLTVEDSYWNSIKQETYSYPSNCTEYVEEVVCDDWLVQRNAEQFGPVNPADPEKDVFFYLAHKRLENKLRVMKRKRLISVNISDDPISESFPSSFPIFFRIMGDDYVVKSILCNATDTLEHVVQLVLAKKQKFRAKTSFNDDAASRLSKRRGTMFGHGNVLQFGGEADASQYIARISGFFEYIEDFSVPLYSIRYIQECIKRDKKIKLTLEERVMKLTPEINSIGSQREIQTQIIMKKEPCISSRSVHLPFAMKIVVVEGSEIFDDTMLQMETETCPVRLFLECYIKYGSGMIGTIMRTQKRTNTLFADILSNRLKVSELPRESQLVCTLFARYSEGDVVLASRVVQLFDAFGRLLTGSQRINMKVHSLSHRTIKVETAPAIIIEFISSSIPIVHIPFPVKLETPLPPTPQEVEEVERILWFHQLQWLKEREKNIVWKNRIFILNNYPKCIASLLNSVPWLVPREVQELHLLLRKWPLLEPTLALRLIDSNYADTEVRKFGVRCLANISDDDLQLYLLQLVQAIKYEPYHYSDLVMFLLNRSLQDPDVIGHHLFWFLRSELDINPDNDRFRCILEQFMFIHGAKSHCFYRQCDLVNALKSVASVVKVTKPNRRNQVLREALNSLAFPAGSVLPVNPALQIRGLIIEKCRWLDSFTVPLWLVFENFDHNEDPICVIFKAGDDLRQDALTVQMLQIMDNLWRKSGLDMHLTPYRVVATGNESGMIEVVLNAETTANIQKMAGGASAVFSLKPLEKWLMEHNKHTTARERAVENFLFSMAGYCVATYVLGIGDRHNDNIMVTKEGHLFHIDFAHFLGNVMKFYGFKRERAPFVLTPDFVQVIGGKDSPGWERFVDLCCDAFNRMRKHASIFITLFTLMISSGIPQLTAQEDLHYLIESFLVGKTDLEARQIFSALITESLNTKATQLNFAIHILAHRD